MTMPKTATPLLSLALGFLEAAKVNVSQFKREDGSSFNFSYWLGCALLMQGRPCPPDVVGRFKQLLRNLLESSDGLLSYIDACSALRLAVVKAGRCSDEIVRSVQHRWVRGIWSLYCYATKSTLVVHPSRQFDLFVTWLGWLKRLPVCVPEPREGIQKAIQDDERLRSYDYDLNAHVPGIRKVWHEWFSTFHLRSPFRPRHGSGSTADAGRVRAHKWASLRLDQAARVCLRGTDLQDIGYDFDRDASRVSKIVFVPKQAGKDRMISMEPAWLQFLQQGVAAQLIEFAGRNYHPLSDYVDFSSQDRNRRLCACATWRKLATIDLTSASDSVSYRLIKTISTGLPLWKYLYGTRSTRSIHEGVSYEFDRFAPMGSALCFPIETFLFSSIVEYSYRTYFGKASEGHHSGCSVYGDDIIVPQELYQLVTEVLVSLGFQVNHQKSFCSGIYFESCGVEYCDGVMINTIRHPRADLYRDGEIGSPDQIGMVTDLANSMLDFGVLSARRMLLKYYAGCKLRVGTKVKPFMDFVIWGPTHCRSLYDTVEPGRWNYNLQRWERRCKSIQAIARHSRFDVVEYFHNVEFLTREERMDRTSRRFRRLDCDPKWSLTGLTALAGMGHFDLLVNGEVHDVCTSSTGRLRYVERYHYLET